MICKKCGKTKKPQDFQIRKKVPSGRKSKCKECMSYEYSLDLPYKEKKRNKELIKRYGIDLQVYGQMWKDQLGRCAICNKHESEFKTRLAVDHNHKTGKVRGLLCFPCNRFKLGRLNIVTAKAVYDYLIKYDGAA